MKKVFTCLSLALSLVITARSQSTQIASFPNGPSGAISPSVASGSKLFFSAYDPLYGRELWCTDGTQQGTYLVKDIYPGTANAISGTFQYSSYDVNGILYFKADNGITGPDLWRSDGTESGTYLVKDLYSDGVDRGISNFAAIGNVLYFTVNGTSLWRSNGTDAGTYSIKSFQIVRSLSAFNNAIYFSASLDNSGEELWKSNGTAGGTFLLKDLNGVYGASLPCNFHATGNALYFMAATDADWEMWKTTGTASSTVIVKDINPNGNGVLSYYSEAAVSSIGNTIYFKATDGVTGFQLWKSDGTDAGTVRVSALPDGVQSNFPVVNGNVLFSSYNSTHFFQYNPVTDAVSSTHYPYFYSTFNSFGKSAVFVGARLFYAGMDSLYGAEMWHSNGKPNGNRQLQETHLVNNWRSSNNNGFNTILGQLGSKLLFLQARMPYNGDVPVFVYDTAVAVTAFAPNIVVPVPLPSQKMHLVWNRVEQATKYEVRYKIYPGGTAWKYKKVAVSYAAFTALNINTQYAFEVRAYCNNQWSPWSTTTLYTTSRVYSDYILHILADRAVDANIMRIYWLKTVEIEKMQIRYRLAGTAEWSNVQNANGMAVLKNLAPASFYEYQYRAFRGSWENWVAFYLYFQTPQSGMSSKPIAKKATALGWAVTPNPASGMVYISGQVPLPSHYTITDLNGVVLKTGVLTSPAINLSGIKGGMLVLSIQKDGVRQSVKILKL